MTVTRPQTIQLHECESCGRRWETTFAGCPYCGGTAIRRERFEGRGTIYSWVEVCRSLDDPPVDVPYTVVVVQLDAGARVFGRYLSVRGPHPGEVVIAVDSCFDPAGVAGTRAFRPARED